MNEPTLMEIRSVAVVIINYGTAELAIDAVESVLAFGHGGRTIDVHLLDNCSPGTDAETFREVHARRGWGGRVTLHLEEENHGFGRGNNVVIREIFDRDLSPDAIFFLNPDAVLINEAIDLLATCLEANIDVGFAGSAISKAEAGPVTAAFRFPSIAAEFSNAVGFGPVTRLLARYQVPLGPDCPPGKVDWVSGAAFMARSETLRQIGLFDPDFFLYFEEVELMWRGRKAGWTTAYVPEARVRHFEGAATDIRSNVVRRTRYPRYRYVSWRLYHIKTAGKAKAACIALVALAGAFLGKTIAAMRGRSDEAVPYFISDFWAYSVKPMFAGGGRVPK